MISDVRLYFIINFVICKKKMFLISISACYHGKQRFSVLKYILNRLGALSARSGSFSLEYCEETYMYSVQHLLYFCKVVETHSMNSAAEELYITQPALSRAIKSLESELHVELFKRSNRGVVPTEAGERLYRYASRLLHQMDLITNLAETGPDPVLSLSVFPFLFTGPLLEKYLITNERRESRLEIEECRVGQVITNVAEGLSELGLVQYNQAQSREFGSLLKKNKLLFTPIVQSEWRACVGPASPFYRMYEVTLEQLSSIPLIRLRDDYLSSLTGGMKDTDITLDELTHSFVGSSYLILHLLRKADCWYVASQADEGAAQEYGLHLLPISTLGVRMNIGFIQKEDRSLSPAAEDFAAYAALRLQEAVMQ